jgi:biotin operon repressor
MARPRTPPHSHANECCPACGQQAPQRNLFRHKAMMNQTELARAVAYSPELTDGEKAMVLLLIAEMDFENWIPVSQAEIARRLGVTRATVNERFTRLRELGIVLDGGRGPGGHKQLKLSAAYVWKGKGSGHARHYHVDRAATARKREEAARRRREKLKVVEPAE